MIIWLILALIAAVLQVFAIRNDNKNIEFFAKPAVMLFLLIWLYTSTGFQGKMIWFGLGLVFSLVGDTLLINSSNRMFILGLIAFLFTHIFYIFGFKEELLRFTG